MVASERSRLTFNPCDRYRSVRRGARQGVYILIDTICFSERRLKNTYIFPDHLSLAIFPQIYPSNSFRSHYIPCHFPFSKVLQTYLRVSSFRTQSRINPLPLLFYNGQSSAIFLQSLTSLSQRLPSTSTSRPVMANAGALAAPLRSPRPRANQEAREAGKRAVAPRNLFSSTHNLYNVQLFGNFYNITAMCTAYGVPNAI